MNYSNYEDTFLGALGIFAIVIILVVLAAAIVGVIANWKLFKKAGKNGWECIVPIYSYWVLMEIAGLNWWWLLLILANNIVDILGIEDLSSIASLVSLFASFNCYYNIAKKFNKSTGTAVCAGLFNFIFILIFGFSKNEVYNINIPVSKNGVFGTPENNNYQNNSYQGNGQTLPTYNNTFNNDTNMQYQQQNNQGVMNNGYVGPSQPVQEFSFCGNCGTKITKDTRFCPNCGKENL